MKGVIVIVSFYFTFLFILLMQMFFEFKENIIYSLFIIILAILFVSIIIRWMKKHIEQDRSNNNSILSEVLFLIAALIVTADNNFIFSVIILVVFWLIVFYGIIKKDSYFKAQGWILICFCMLMGSCFLNPSNWLFTIVATLFLVFSLIIEGIVVNDSEEFKIFNYLILLLWIKRIGYQVSNMGIYSNNHDSIEIITYGVMGLLNVAMIKMKFYKTKNTREETGTIHILLDILNLIFIIYGTCKMYTSKVKITYTIIVFFLSCVNLPVKDKGSNERYIYTAIKFAFLIYYTLSIFNTASVVISICMIAFSVVCISFGFINRLIGKNLRILGLVMTLVFVIKLIIIDINYDNSILKAISYLISGMLCFGISAIYNYFEKKKVKIT